MYEEYTNHVSKDISREIKDFVKEDIFGNSEYLFINKVDGVNKGYCSKCSNEYDVGDIKHNEDGICPSCGANLRAKLLRYGRQNCLNEACFYFFEKSIADINVVVCKGYYVTKDYAVDYKNPKIVYNLRAIYIFDDKKAIMLKSNYWNDDDWDMKNSVFDFNQGYLATKMCYCSFKSIGKTIKGTSYQYIPYKKFQGHYSIVKLFEEYLKYPGIEYLVKEGFENLVEDKLNRRSTHRTVNWNGKTIFQILKLNKVELREIKAKKVHVTFNFLKVFQDVKKQKWGLSTEEVIKVTTEYQDCYDSLKNMLEYSSIKSLLKYFNKQYVKYNKVKKNKHYRMERSVLTTFKDYIRDCISLGMDIAKEQVIFPKNLYTAHQNTIKQLKLKADETLNLKMQGRMELLDNYNFEFNGLILRAARSSNELIEEGKSLSHCVGTYADRHAKGETNIFFIRKTSDPDKSYYTIEVKKDIIIQIHGKDNRSPSVDVQEFIKIFTEEKLNKKTKKNRIRISA
ncbi:PcfJ domain-containing protein [Clostridium tagluense]|uniref:PcfJ-like protein n=1 Tax=Clostridium tagluense TaxID=360422 RepID=A0A401UUR1_9CLOT|nr:PcfJ domain-containing protein [Clostridium tagluense]GCD13178.1 hypothetical protein Ctaglu_48010 [Clostridium tagluense]